MDENNQEHVPSTPANRGLTLHLPNDIVNNSYSAHHPSQHGGYHFPEPSMYSNEQMTGNPQMQQFSPRFMANPSGHIVYGELPPRRRRPIMAPLHAANPSTGGPNTSGYAPRSPPRVYSPDWQDPLPDDSSEVDLPGPGESILPKPIKKSQHTQSTQKTAAAAKAPKKKEKSTKAKKIDESDKRGGRAQGARNFTGQDMLALVKIVGLRKPLGPDGWEAVAKDYNEWAKKNGSAVRDRTSLRHKFDSIVRTASEKPTGEGERLELYHDALRVNDEITVRASMVTLDDDTGEKSDVVSLTDNETESGSEHTGKDKKQPGKSIKAESKAERAGKPEKSLVTVKSYKVTDPLEPKPRRGHPGAQQTANAMGSIGTYFSADSVRERDETRTVQAMQHAQLQSAQTEIRELRSQVASFQEKYFSEARRADAEGRRADQAESEIRMLKTVYEMSSGPSRRRRHHSPSSDSDIPRHYKKRSSRRRQRSHSYSKSPSPVRTSSKHTLDDEGMLVKMTPKKNKDGQVTRVEVTPA